MKRTLRICVFALAGCLSVIAATAQTEPAVHSQSGYSISGVVVSAKTGLPLDEAHVTISDTGEYRLVAETVTNSEGRFSFTNLGAGKFSLRASHNGFVGAAYDEHPGGISTAIVTGPDLVSTDLRFVLESQAAIYGAITEDSGDPVPQARVSLYKPDPRGTGKMMRVAVIGADQLGNYEFPHLAAGTYYLCIVGTPWYATRAQPPVRDGSEPRSPLDVAYAMTCHPGVSDANAAEPISVGAGDRVPVNVAMHAVLSVHITMQLPVGGDGRSVSMPQIRKDIFGYSEYMQPAVSSYASPGDAGVATSIEVGGLAPGHYDVEFSNSSPESSRFTSINAASESMSFDPSSAALMAEVTGKLAKADGSNFAPGVAISLTPHEGQESMAAGVNPDGSFHIGTLRSGEYEVTVSDRGYAMTVAHLAAKGAAVSGHLLLAAGEPVELTATVIEASATVNGFAKVNGKPASGVFVVLVPSDARAGRYVWQPNQSDSDGSFNFPHVIPGNYTVVAIAEGWTLDWARPEVIAPYLGKGVKVTVRPGAKDVSLSEAVEAQPKLP